METGAARPLQAAHRTRPLPIRYSHDHEAANTMNMSWPNNRQAILLILVGWSKLWILGEDSGTGRKARKVLGITDLEFL